MQNRRIERFIESYGQDKYSHTQAGLYTGKLTEYIRNQDFVELSDNMYIFKDNLEY